MMLRDARSLITAAVLAVLAGVASLFRDAVIGDLMKLQHPSIAAVVRAITKWSLLPYAFFLLAAAICAVLAVAYLRAKPVVAAAVSAEPPITLRAQIHDVVYRLRALIASFGENPTDDEEGDLTLAFGSSGLAAEIHAVRSRIRNFTGVTPTMRTMIGIMPVGKRRLTQIADLLEQFASSVPEDALATPRSSEVV